MRRSNARRRIAMATVAGAAALLLAACTSATPSGLPVQQPGGFSKDIEKRLDSAMTEAMALADASGAVVGVWAPWAGSWTAALGTTTRGGTTPMTTDMDVRIGQNTVGMTCTVMLELVDEGRIGLDEPLTEYLPGMVGVGGVTMRELCQNTSGLGDYTGQLTSQFLANPTREWPPLELASDGIATKRVGNPGERYGRSATNAVLVGMAIENVTNQSWPQLYKHYIFDRLGMSSSVLPESGQYSIVGPHPAGYSVWVDGAGAIVCDPMHDVSLLSPSQGWTSGGVVSDLADMKTFAQSLATGSLLSQKSRDAQADAVVSGASWERYGLGVQLLGPLRGGSGSIPGYLTAMFADPSSGLTIVVALNNSTPGSGFAQLLAQRLAAIVSKVPAEQKGAKVVASLPWSEQQAVDALAKSAPCPAKKAG
jgi:D-alanyl-D-alanine carboxypeptidase